MKEITPLYNEIFDKAGEQKEGRKEGGDLLKRNKGQVSTDTF